MANRSKQAPRGLSEAVAQNVRKYAYLGDLTHEELAAHMTSRGFPMKKASISAITGGRRMAISVDETAAFAEIFELPFEDMLIAPTKRR